MGKQPDRARSIDTEIAARPADLLGIVIDQITQGMVIAGKDYRVIAFNSHFENIFQLPSGTVRVGADFRDILRVWAEATGQGPDMLERAIKNLDLSATYEVELHQRIHGEPRWCMMMHKPLPGGGFVRTFADITERKRAEDERLATLRFFESMDKVNRAMQGTGNLERMLSDVLEAVLAIFDCDRAWLFYPCDPEAASWRVPMERTKPEYPGALALGVDMPMTPDTAATIRIALASDGPVKLGPGTANPFPVVNTEMFSVKSILTMALYPKEGKPWMLGLHQCSHTRAWTAEDERLFKEVALRLTDALTGFLAYRGLKRALKEKEVLLSEVHHRVKNNMAIVSSLLNLQAPYLKDADDRSMLKEAQARIKSMALVHEKLYQSSDFSSIELGGYIESLVGGIGRAFSGKLFKLNYRVEARGISLGMDTIIPCGLIINELLINSIKHAFDGERPPEVAVEIKEAGPAVISLTVSDNGKGLPEEVGFNGRMGLGLKLVETLSHQLMADVTVEREGGTTFRLVFPKTLKDKQ